MAVVQGKPLRGAFPVRAEPCREPSGRKGSGAGVSRLVSELQDSGRCQRKKSKPADGVIVLTHTEVPRELAGRGIGSRLVEKALADIDRQGLRLIPRCSFVAGYIRKNPRWERIVARE